MTAASLYKSAARNGLQPVDLGRHLGGIATLIELCFGAELDASGRGLIREMQLLSRAGPALRLVQALLLQHQPWGLGYVWVEDGRVIGTVSTQRAAPRSAAWLVANVAVHPNHRRRGIALALMRATLDLIRSQGGSEVVLQVDDDNLGAIALYRQLGFGRVTTRTAWSRPGYLGPPPFQASPFDIRLRGPGEWIEQLALAALVRPEGLAWGRPLRADDFRPGLRRQVEHFFTARHDEHWVAQVPGLPLGQQHLEHPLGPTAGRQPPLAGSLSLQMAGPDGDRLTLLVHPHYQGQLERPLLVRALRRLGRRPWSTRLEAASDDEAAAQALADLGFRPGRVLRWMRAALR
jgi:ribosomal protein S18 acetylase RimI-like enzyme